MFRRKLTLGVSLDKNVYRVMFLRVEEKSGRKNWGKRNDREKTTKNNDNFVRVIYRFVPWNEGKRDRKRWCIGMVG